MGEGLDYLILNDGIVCTLYTTLRVTLLCMCIIIIC